MSLYQLSVGGSVVVGGSVEKDFIEENNAASSLISHLIGKPIVSTSGDDEHELNPTAIEFKVGLTKRGEELAISITQTDKHHPHLVYCTITKNLGELEEFRNCSLKPLQPEYDHDIQNGKITVRYNLPSGVADSIIHSLSERTQRKDGLQEMRGIVQKPVNNNWIDKIIKHFSVGNGNYRG